MEIKREFEFTLSSPVSYQAEGQAQEGRLLTLTAPSNKVRAQRAKLKEAFMMAIAEAGEQEKEQKAVPQGDQKDTVIEEDEFSEYVLMMLYSSPKVNIVDMLEEFKGLMIHGQCCTIEGSVKMTAPIFDSMDADDCDRLLGEYMANFILASFLNKIRTK